VPASLSKACQAFRPGHAPSILLDEVISAYYVRSGSGAFLVANLRHGVTLRGATASLDSGDLMSVVLYSSSHEWCWRCEDEAELNCEI
jgi:hypothetical protein